MASGGYVGVDRLCLCSRADVADFMIKAVEDRSSIGKIAGVCN
jgi:hypothetical protein